MDIPPASITTPLGIGKRLCGRGGYMPFKGVIDNVTIATNFQGSWMWTELVDPRSGDSMDLAFKLTTVEPTEDFGDAPDPAFPTLRASDGARHTVVPKVLLGKLIDAEFDGQPNATATGDDSNNLADEDGVVLGGGAMVPGDWSTVQVTASTNGFLSAWVDFQADGSWATPGDQIFTNLALPAGTNTLNFYVPTSAAQANNVFARFRFSTSVITNFTGWAPDGEVEDYAWYVHEVDYGDAPDPTFPTLHASDGARHWRWQGLQLGALWDRETDGQPNATATGDDLANLADEDGVQLLTPMLPGQVAWIRVFPSLPNTFLSAWIDFGADGSWAPAERLGLPRLRVHGRWPDQPLLRRSAQRRGGLQRLRPLPLQHGAGPQLHQPDRAALHDAKRRSRRLPVAHQPARLRRRARPDLPDLAHEQRRVSRDRARLLPRHQRQPSGMASPTPPPPATRFDDGVFFVTPLTLASQACVQRVPHRRHQRRQARRLD